MLIAVRCLPRWPAFRRRFDAAAADFRVFRPVPAGLRRRLLLTVAAMI